MHTKDRRARTPTRLVLLLLLCLPAGALAQQARPSTTSAEAAADRVTQAQPAVHLMDQEIARALSGGKARDGVPPPASVQARQQSAHRSYLEQRTTFLAVVRAAEQHPSITPEQIAVAGEELEQRYRRVLAVFR